MKLRKASLLLVAATMATPAIAVGSAHVAGAATPPDACAAYIQGRIASDADIAALGPNLPGGLVPQDPLTTYAATGHLIKGQDKMIMDTGNTTPGAKVIDVNVTLDDTPALNAGVLAAAALPGEQPWSTVSVDGTTAIKYSMKNNKLTPASKALPSIQVTESTKTGLADYDVDGPNGPAPAAPLGAVLTPGLKNPRAKGAINGFPGGLNPTGTGPLMYRNLNGGTNGQNSIITVTGMFANAYNQDGTPSGLKSTDVQNRQMLLAVGYANLISTFGPTFESTVVGVFAAAAPGAPTYIPTGDPCGTAGLVATICELEPTLLPAIVSGLCAIRNT